MNQNSLYDKLVQEYYFFKSRKGQLTCERDNINAKLGMIDSILDDLEVILDKHGNHIHDHFEEKKSHESEG